MRRRPSITAPSLKDVGREVGVSYQTVSRVMNGSLAVKDDTREQVLAAARRLGFRVNRVAGSLRKRQSNAIGLVMSDVENIFFARVVGGVEAEAALHDYSVILANSAESLDREKSAVIGMLERRVDGLIIASAEGDHAYIGEEVPAQFPLVAINRTLGDVHCGAVLTDNVGGARTAMSYLFARGHTRIGILIESKGLITSRERLQGYREAMAEASLPVRDEWICAGGMRPEETCAAALRVLTSSAPPTALFAASNRLAEGAIVAIRQLGLRRNDDVEVIGFDDTPWARLLDPPLPVIAQDTYEIGRQAVRMLLGRMKDEGEPAQVIRLPTRLITYEATSPPTHPHR